MTDFKKTTIDNELSSYKMKHRASGYAYWDKLEYFLKVASNRRRDKHGKESIEQLMPHALDILWGAVNASHSLQSEKITRLEHGKTR